MLIAAAVFWLSLIATPAFSHFPIPPKKPEIGRQAVQRTVPDFSLVDQRGKLFRFTDARGKIVLATFIFTACPDVCPLLTAKFAGIERALEKRKLNDFLLLSITTDPQRDSPEALKKYAERFRADFNHWLFLTGAEKDLAKVWKEFGVMVQKTPDGQIQHTALTTLIDRRGVRRIDYYTDQWQEKEILQDIRSLNSGR